MSCIAPLHEVAVRCARLADVAALARLHARCHLQTYATHVDRSVLAARSIQSRARMWREVIANGGAVHLATTDEPWPAYVGFAHAISRADHSELTCLYVDQRWHGTGTGFALLAAAISSCEPMHDVVVWALANNQRAWGFYERAGFEPTDAWQPDPWGAGLRVVAARMSAQAASAVRQQAQT